MKLAEVKARSTNWRDWELNPIVLKELRQAVRSWAVTGMLLIFLLALFVVALGFLISQSFLQGAGDNQLGGSLFGAFLVVLAAAGILFIPLYTGLRVAAERQDNNPDLLYISTLSPGGIIRGKFFCGAYLALLFFSVCLPFMALTNLLRGVDLPTVFFLLVFLFILVCGANLAAIFIACLPVSKLFKILMGLGGLLALFFLLMGAMSVAFEMMGSGVGAMMFQRQFWGSALTYMLLATATGGLFYVLSVALISPLSANRALVPRAYLTGFWLAGGVLAEIAAIRIKMSAPVLVWAYISSALLLAALVVTVSNHDRLSVRVRRAIPPGGLPRRLAFGFYNGAAGGLVWVTVLAVLTYFGAWLRQYWRPEISTGVDPGPMDSFLAIYPPMALYFFAYALFGLFLQRRFMPRLAPKIAGILAVFITALTALATNIVLFFTNQLSWRSAEHLELGNAFNLVGAHEARPQNVHMVFALMLLVLALVLNARWFATQWNNFRPPPASVPPKLL